MECTPAAVPASFALRPVSRSVRPLVVALLAVVLGAVPARAQSGGGTRLGLRAAAFFPSDAEVRRAFADVIPWPGIAIVPPARPGATGVYPSIELMGARSGSDRFLIVPLTLAIEHQWRGSGGRYVPYARGDAGIAYFDYRLRRGESVVRARRGGAAGGAELGMIFTRALRAGVRYRLFQEMDDLTFSGIEVGVVIGALRIF